MIAATKAPRQGMRYPIFSVSSKNTPQSFFQMPIRRAKRYASAGRSIRRKKTTRARTTSKRPAKRARASTPRRAGTSGGGRGGKSEGIAEKILATASELAGAMLGPASSKLAGVAGRYLGAHVDRLGAKLQSHFLDKYTEVAEQGGEQHSLYKDSRLTMRNSATGIRGHGDYTVTGSGFTNGAGAGSSGVPVFGGSGKRSTRIQNREYLGEIYPTGIVPGTAAAGQLYSVQYSINPGDSKTFPWLSTMAQNFEEYKLNGCIFEFRSELGSANGNLTNEGSMGSVMMATQYNSLARPFGTKQQMLETEFSVSAKPSSHLMHAVECARAEMPLKAFYIRTGPRESNQTGDIRMMDIGIVTIATQDTVGTRALGELWISYDVDLYKPKLSTAGAGAGTNYLWNSTVYQGPAGASGTDPSTWNPRQKAWDLSWPFSNVNYVNPFAATSKGRTNPGSTLACPPIPGQTDVPDQYFHIGTKSYGGRLMFPDWLRQGRFKIDIMMSNDQATKWQGNSSLVMNRGEIVVYGYTEAWNTPDPDWINRPRDMTHYSHHRAYQPLSAPPFNCNPLAIKFDGGFQRADGSLLPGSIRYLGVQTDSLDVESPADAFSCPARYRPSMNWNIIAGATLPGVTGFNYTRSNQRMLSVIIDVTGPGAHFDIGPASCAEYRAMGSVSSGGNYITTASEGQKTGTLKVIVMQLPGTGPYIAPVYGAPTQELVF